MDKKVKKYKEEFTIKAGESLETITLDCRKSFSEDTKIIIKTKVKFKKL